MKNLLIKKQIINRLESFEESQQLQVLNFASFLVANNNSVGVPGKSLLIYAGSIDEKDLDLMSDAIKVKS